MIYVFDDCELDTLRCELRRGGRPCHVEPQVFDLLAYLAAHPDRLVTRDELFDSVWGHRYITPATLNSRLKAARQAIGDDGAVQRVIRTVRGRGFRFMPPVERRSAGGDTRGGVEGGPDRGARGSGIPATERVGSGADGEAFGAVARDPGGGVATNGMLMAELVEPEAVADRSSGAGGGPGSVPMTAGNRDEVGSVGRLANSTAAAGSASAALGPGTAPAGSGTAAIGTDPMAIGPRSPAAAIAPQLTSHFAAPPAELVARGAELDRLRALYQASRSGRRRIALVAGEPGIGKTTLAEAFLRELPDGTVVARGQCLEQHGIGEPYLPVLDALGRLCRGPRADAIVRLLDRYAPTWLAQLPAADEARLEAQRRSLGATRDRMLREIVEMLEALSESAPVVILLEDLHWSDPSTLDLIVWLAQRRTPASILVIGTYRPGDTGTAFRPAIGHLTRSEAATEIALGRWTVDDVASYLERHHPGLADPAALAATIHRTSDGTPLYVQILLSSWIENGILLGEGAGWRLARPVEDGGSGVPDSIRSMIAQRLDRLDPPEQTLLEAGSVVGQSFAVSLVAAALGLDDEEVETGCAALARHGGFLLPESPDDWPDGTLTARFAFAHHLYQTTLYERIPIARRTRYHRAIGARLAAGYGAEAAEVAGELAHHFAMGRDEHRAIDSLGLAAEQALARSAHREAIAYLEDALDRLRRHPDHPDALRVELELQRMLGPALLLTRGWGDSAAEAAYRRAREISERLHDSTELARALHGMAYLHEIRGDFHRSQPLLEEALGLACIAPGPYTSIEAQELLSCSLFHQGKFESAAGSARAALESLQPLNRTDPFAASLGMNASLAAHYWLAHALWCLGHPDQAMEPVHAALRIAEQSQLIYMLAASHVQVAQLFHFRREVEPLVSHADAGFRIAERQGYPFHQALALTLRGWAAAMSGDLEPGLETIRHGIEMQRAMGTDIERPYSLALLAEALLNGGRYDEGLEAADEALAVIAERSRAFFWQAEIHRIRGELLARSDRLDEGLAAFENALGIARSQGARSLELRALVSICRLGPDSRGELETVVRHFDTATETVDLGEARALLGAI
jgi:DNA-binding winged helix-turn-helix (wHTH) protein/tetratricopeptide (TPR) repeat protein